MKFTKATKENNLTITLINSTLYVRHCLDHSKDEEIRAGLKTAKYRVTDTYGPCSEDTGYTVTGGTLAELKQVEEELKVEYGLVEKVEDTALLSRIAIEIAYGAAKSYGRRLTSKDVPPGFDVIKAAQTDSFMNECLETAWRVIKILK